MLMPGDADLVRRDPRLPGLALLLDPEAFSARLCEHFRGIDPARAAPTYVRHKPGTSCVVAYQLSQNGKQVDVHAHACVASELPKLKKIFARSHAAASAGWSAVWPQDAVMVSFFPNDGKLLSLGRLVDADSRRRLLRKLFPARPDAWNATVDRLRYKPQRRYVGRVAIAGKPLALLKCYTDIGYAAALHATNAFPHGGFARLAKRIGKLNRHRMLAFEWLPGRLLSDLIVEDCSLDRVADTGVALAGLHYRGAMGLTHRTRGAEIRGLHAVTNGLDQLCPWLSDRVHRLTDCIAGWLASQPSRDRPIHGDFDASQVLIADESISIIDLDEAVYGDPLQDVGTFLAHLERAAISGLLTDSGVSRIKDALVDGYQSVVGAVDLSQINMYTAAALVRLAPHSFRQREPDWPDRTGAIVKQAESLAEAPNRSCVNPRNWVRASVPVADVFHAAADPHMPWLAQAIDPCQIQQSLLECCPSLEEGRARVRAIRVVRHKPRRRCLIEYDIGFDHFSRRSGLLTLVGKVRAKGADAATYRLLACLRKAGLSDESASDVCVPEPVGIIPDLRMWLQNKVPGRPATELLLGDEGLAIAARVADAIHQLHESRVMPARRHTMVDELAILNERLSLVAHMKPEWSTRLARVLDACARLGRAASQPALRGIHRDFYADHVVVDGPRLWLIDFDLYCQGDPALDIGNFQGHLIEQSLRLFGRADALADRQAALEDRFAELAGDGARMSSRIYTTLTLVRHIFLSTQFPARRKLTEPLLHLCEERLAATLAPLH